MVEVKVVEDSVNSVGNRLTTFQLRYWRAIHAEFMTHRMFSRNASSSRAIPVATIMKQVREAPASPVHWGANQPGMQADAELSPIGIVVAKTVWSQAANSAADFAEQLAKLGVHKQIANRLMEPFQYISVVVSATEWNNFYELRIHKDAQPEIQELAREMKKAQDASTPKKLKCGEWHLPYVTQEERSTLDVYTQQQISTARCARVSYLKHDGATPSIEEDKKLYERLVGGRPLHASPCEHQAKAMDDAFSYRNFRGWSPFRISVEALIKSKLK